MSKWQSLLEDLMKEVDPAALQKAYQIKRNQKLNREFVGVTEEGIVYLHCHWDHDDHGNHVRYVHDEDVITWEEYEEIKDEITTLIDSEPEIIAKREYNERRFRELRDILRIHHDLLKPQVDALERKITSLKNSQKKSPLSKDWGSLILAEEVKLKPIKSIVGDLSSELWFLGHGPYGMIMSDKLISEIEGRLQQVEAKLQKLEEAKKE